MERGMLVAAGTGLALFGGLFAVYFVGELTSGTSEAEPGVNAGLVVFFGGLLVAGLGLAWWAWRGGSAAGRGASGAARPGTGGPRAASQPQAPPATAEEREVRMLRLAERRRGRLTIPEAASGCSMSIAEAKAELDRLVLQQVASLQVTQAGVLVYVFPGFMTDEEKAQATDF